MTDKERINLLTTALKVYADPKIYRTTLTVTKVDKNKAAVTFGLESFEIGERIKYELDEGKIAREALERVGIE